MRVCYTTCMEAQEVREIVLRYAREYDIKLAVLFGSHARGTSRAGSDVDIAFLANPRLETARLAELQIVLSDAMGARVDLADFADASPLLLRQIAIEGKPLYEAESGMYMEARVQAMLRYFDARPLLDIRTRLTLTPTQV